MHRKELSGKDFDPGTGLPTQIWPEIGSSSATDSHKYTYNINGKMTAE